MIYIKYFLFYSILGFLFESTVFKISNVNKHSGILSGPYTIVYGIGGLLSLIINNYLEKITNPFLNIFSSYIFFVLICTSIEFISGNVIKLIFKIDSWDYSNHKYHYGKYICLDYALIWGLLAIIMVKGLKTFFNNISFFIPNYATILLLTIIILDFLWKIRNSIKIN